MDMDINTIRGLATLFALIAFLALIGWAYSSRRKKDFDEAASLPFAETDLEAHNQSDGRVERTSSQTEESKNNE